MKPSFAQRNAHIEVEIQKKILWFSLFLIFLIKSELSFISADTDCCWYIYSFDFHHPASHGSSGPFWAPGSFERGEQHCQGQGGPRKDCQGCFEYGFEGYKRVQRPDLWWKRAGEGGSGAGSLVWRPPSLSVSKKIGQDQEPHKKSPTQTSVKWNTGFFNSTRLCI